MRAWRCPSGFSVPRSSCRSLHLANQLQWWPMRQPVWTRMNCWRALRSAWRGLLHLRPRPSRFRPRLHDPPQLAHGGSAFRRTCLGNSQKTAISAERQSADPQDGPQCRADVRGPFSAAAMAGGPGCAPGPDGPGAVTMSTKHPRAIVGTSAPPPGRAGRPASRLPGQTPPAARAPWPARAPKAADATSMPQPGNAVQRASDGPETP